MEWRWYIVKPRSVDTGPVDLDALFGGHVHGSGGGIESPAVELG